MPPHVDTSLISPLSPERRGTAGQAKLGNRSLAKRPPIRQSPRGKDFLQRLREAGL